MVIPKPLWETVRGNRTAMLSCSCLFLLSPRILHLLGSQQVLVFEDRSLQIDDPLRPQRDLQHSPHLEVHFTRAQDHDVVILSENTPTTSASAGATDHLHRNHSEQNLYQTLQVHTRVDSVYLVGLYKYIRCTCSLGWA